MLPDADTIGDVLAGCQIYSAFDVYWGYDGVLMDDKSRVKTAFVTDIGKLANGSLPMGSANAIPEYQGRMNFAFSDLIGKGNFCIFMDDPNLGGPKTNYNGELVAPNIRRFVFEHLQDLNEVFH